jgi:hypothetical protein
MAITWFTKRFVVMIVYGSGTWNFSLALFGLTSWKRRGIVCGRAVISGSDDHAPKSLLSNGEKAYGSYPRIWFLTDPASGLLHLIVCSALVWIQKKMA